MAQNAVNINILSNERQAVKGAENVADAFEDVSDRLHDLTKEGDKSTDRMEQDFRDLTKAADRSSDALKDKFRAAYRDVRKASESTADDVVRDQRRMGERSQEVGQEIRQNLGEGIANAARGDFESLSDTIGDTFGGAVAGIGGIGFAAVGAAGALGVGALVAAFQQAEEQRKKLEERAADLASAYIDAGTSALDAMTIASRAQDYLTNPEQRKEAEALAKALGVDVADAARALAGDANTLAVANKIVADSDRERLDLLKQSTDYVSGEFTEAERKRLDQLIAQKQAVRDLNEVNGIATKGFEDQQRMMRDLIAEAGTATEQIDDLGNKLYTLPDGTQIVISADTGEASFNVDKFKGDVATIPATTTTTARFLVDDQALRNANRQFDELRRKAEAGITVNMRNVNGRQLV